ncbi:MAG: hypothetical protein H7X95_06865, partial [Deltaproteobacteria bacterium]|nr:hypothetical protein [Deltaproteobacteria bacterium]
MNKAQRHRTTLNLGLLLLLAGAVAGTLSVQGCGDNWPPVVVAAPFSLRSVVDAALVKPGENTRVSFTLTIVSSGLPVADERIEFSAVDDPQLPGTDLAGATLAASSALTDRGGVATIIVTGGLPTFFRLTARQPRAPVADVLVVVSDGDQGKISIVATPVGGSVGALLLTSVDVYLMDALSCSGLAPSLPPKSARPV